ncbi:MAG: hypothetical protein J5836_01770 [Clostridia bacterium]|nr:hypothetical protein [Clostridia bacterium]
MKKIKYYLSFAVGILSALTALGFFAVMAYSIISIPEVAKVISDTTDDLAGIKLIAYAGLSYLVAILGIIICGALAGYRGMLGYYYVKTSISDERFYAERKKGYIGFSVLSALMLAALIVAYFAFDGSAYKTVLTALVALIVDYSLLIAVPLIERRIVGFLSKRHKKAPVVSAEKFDKDKITQELDALADVTANLASSSGEEKKDADPGDAENSAASSDEEKN